VLELDHVFFLVRDPADAIHRLQDDGWVLDGGHAHAGQGTRNRRLVWPGLFFEVLWVIDEAEARENVLGLDRRAGWRSTGASPVGLAFRGQFDSTDFWLYDALGPRIWVHGDNEAAPERPLVFVMEATDEQVARRRTMGTGFQLRPDPLRELRVTAPSPPRLPEHAGPRILCTQGAHALELVVDPDADARPIAEGLTIR
jgi:Glyoxalase-like domain